MALVEKSLFQGRGWELRIQPYAEPAVAELLANTTWGTKGGVQYQHKDGRAKVQALKNTSYLTLWHHDKLLGTLGFVEKEMHLNGEAFQGRAYYIRYLSLIQTLQTQTETGKRKKRTEERSPGLGLLRGSLARLFTDQDYWIQAGGDPTQPTVFYAYVIIDNDRSANLVASYGFRSFGEFKTRVFSRLYPKRHAQVRRLRAEEIPAMEARLQERVQQGGWITKNSLRLGENYFVFEEKGEIVAGVQAERVHWVIKNLPGLGGKIARRILPYLPLISRVFNPNDFHYAALDAMYLKPGAERILPALLSHVCVEMNATVALSWWDITDPYFLQIERMPAKGILSPLVQGSGSVHLLARTHEPDAERFLEELGKHPHLIPVEDIT